MANETPLEQIESALRAGRVPSPLGCCELAAPYSPSRSTRAAADPFLRTGRPATTELGTEAGSGDGAMSETAVQPRETEPEGKSLG